MVRQRYDGNSEVEVEVQMVVPSMLLTEQTHPFGEGPLTEEPVGYELRLGDHKVE
jgi:hypothetical protein